MKFLVAAAAMATDLAHEWESMPELRRLAQKLQLASRTRNYMHAACIIRPVMPTYLHGLQDQDEFLGASLWTWDNAGEYRDK